MGTAGRVLVTPTVLAVLVLVLLTWDQSWAGRRDVAGQLHGMELRSCERGVSDRFDDLENWYGAYVARISTARRAREGPGGVDWQAARTYLVTVQDKMRRVDRAHSLTWPDPRVPGARGPFTHPLGFGSFSCERAFPTPRTSPWTFGG